LGELVRTIAAVRRSLNPRLVREGIVLTMHDSRTNLCRDVEAQARAVFGDEVFEATVPRTVRLAEAPSHGRSIFDYDARCKGAVAYEALAVEFLDRMQSQGQSRRVAG
jgi:chromosome partitioning protein